MTLKFNRVVEVTEVHASAKLQPAKCSGSSVINRFRTSLDFNRKYLWNGSSSRQVANAVINYDFFHVRRKELGELWSTFEKMTLAFD